MQSGLSQIQRIVWCGALSVPFILLALADAPPPNPSATPTLHAEARVVQIDVVVLDSNNKPVADLTKADFTVTDEGKPRTIDIFNVINFNRPDAGRGPSTAPASQGPPPRNLPADTFSNRNAGPPALPGHSTVIVLDQVNAYFENAAYGRQQVLNLMSKLPPDERIALYVIARKLGLVIIQDYTDDRSLLSRSVSQYIPRGLNPLPSPTDPDPQDLKNRPSPPGIPPALIRQSPIRELEAMFEENASQARLSLQALAEHLALVPGRKSVYWVTAGFPARLMKGMGQPAWDKTVTALNEANVAVNTIDSRGLFNCHPPGCNAFDPMTGTITTLQEVAEQTGGNAYFNRNDMDAAMAEGINASRTSYTLAFYLSDKERNNRFHSLKVKADRPGLQLFYRQGYYAGNTELPAAGKGSGELEASLLNQVDSTGVGITARVNSTPGTPRGKVDIRLNLDPTRLSLAEKAGGWTGKVQETFVEVNESGNTLAKISDVKEFEVTTANRASYDSQGVAWPFSIPLVQGATRVTIIVRDTVTGHVGSLTIPLM